MQKDGKPCIAEARHVVEARVAPQFSGRVDEVPSFPDANLGEAVRSEAGGFRLACRNARLAPAVHVAISMVAGLESRKPARIEFAELLECRAKRFVAGDVDESAIAGQEQLVAPALRCAANLWRSSPDRGHSHRLLSGSPASKSVRRKPRDFEVLGATGSIDLS